MVRKWSYLNCKSFIIKSKKVFYRVRRKFIYKVFRSTTRFRKFYFKFWSKFLRKSYRRKKHKTNWLVSFNLLYVWVRFYLKYKQHVRYYQSVGLFLKQLHSTSSILFKKQALSMYDVDGFNFYSCSKKILNYFKSNYTLKKGVNQTSNNFIKDVQYTGFQVTEDVDIEKYELINPGLFYYDRLYFSLSNFNKIVVSDVKLTIYLEFKTTFTFLQFQYLVLVYIVSLLLTLRHILN